VAKLDDGVETLVDGVARLDDGVGILVDGVIAPLDAVPLAFRKWLEVLRLRSRPRMGCEALRTMPHLACPSDCSDGFADPCGKPKSLELWRDVLGALGWHCAVCLCGSLSARCLDTGLHSGSEVWLKGGKRCRPEITEMNPEEKDLCMAAQGVS